MPLIIIIIMVLVEIMTFAVMTFESRRARGPQLPDKALRSQTPQGGATTRGPLSRRQRDSNGRLPPEAAPAPPRHRGRSRRALTGDSPATHRTGYFCSLGADSAQALRPRGTGPSSLAGPAPRHRLAAESRPPLSLTDHPGQPGREQPPLTRRGRARRAARGRSRSSGPRRCFASC